MESGPHGLDHPPLALYAILVISSYELFTGFYT